MSYIGKTINNFYCNGFAGRRYDLDGCVIEAEGVDWIIIRKKSHAPIFMEFHGRTDMDKLITSWCEEND